MNKSNWRLNRSFDKSREYSLFWQTGLIRIPLETVKLPVHSVKTLPLTLWTTGTTLSRARGVYGVLASVRTLGMFYLKATGGSSVFDAVPTKERRIPRNNLNGIFGKRYWKCNICHACHVFGKILASLP